MHSSKIGLALLAFFAGTAAAADAPGSNHSKNRRHLRKGGNRNRNRKNRRLATTKRANKNIENDITEDVAFWTRSLQSSFPPTPPTPRPPTPPNPTPAPVPVSVTPNPTDAAPDTPNPTDGNVETPSPTPGSPGGDVPVANDDFPPALSAGGDIAFVSVLVNDTPAIGQELIVKSIVTDAANGECTISLDLTEVTYMPEDSFAGTDTCVYEACDKAAVPACDTATVTFIVA